MVDDEVQKRKSLTFAQAEGLEPLPAQLKRTEVSPELRAVLWNHIYRRLVESKDENVYGETVIGEPWGEVLRDVHVFLFHAPADEFDNSLGPAIGSVKGVIMQGGYAKIYGWLQHVLRAEPDPDFAEEIDQILKACRSPYRVVDDEVLCPVGSDEAAETVARAFVDLKVGGLTGGREHLKLASGELSAGNFAASVRESIHAVESVVKILESSGDFSRALARLEAKTNIHSALKKGFSAIYGFTSDEQGIRHPLLDKDAAAVDEADAMFMIGACSAFVSYLIDKSRAAGLFK
jgi:hypothetical protein